MGEMRKQWILHPHRNCQWSSWSALTPSPSNHEGLNYNFIVETGIVVCKYFKFCWKNQIKRCPEWKKECECSGRTVGKKYSLLRMFVESLKNKKWIREKTVGAIPKCLHIFMNPSRLKRDFLCEDYSIELVRSSRSERLTFPLHMCFSLYQ